MTNTNTAKFMANWNRKKQCRLKKLIELGKINTNEYRRLKIEFREYLDRREAQYIKDLKALGYDI